MNRSLKLSMLLALALGSSQTVALELGQIRVKSALGQPLVAEIPVTPEGPADLRNLSARLASDADFMRAGITEGRTAIPLNFAIVDGPAGSKLIRITSVEAVNDPYLDLLVQVDNAAGKSVREYTILLDPPGAPAMPPPAAAPAPAPAPAAAARPAAPRPAPSPAAAPAPTPAAGDTLAPVQRGQTLSAIAQQVKPAGTDLNQMLLALKQANPDAFYRDNINALKSGAVLRMPTADEAKAMSIAAAAAEVRRQNSDWRAGAVGTPTNVADSATRAGASSSPTAPAGKRDDHLALVPSSEGKAQAAGGQGSSDVRRDLQRSQESLATLQQQSAELRSRLKDLEDINSKNERLLSLKDNEIAELQRKLAEARKGGDAAAAAPAATEAKPAAMAPTTNTSPAADVAATSTTKPAASSTAATTPSADAAKPMPAAAGSSAKATAAVSPAASKATPAKPVAKKPAAPAGKAAAPRAEEAPWYMQTWAWGAGGAVVVLGLLLALRSRRAKPADKPAGGSSLADRFGALPMADGEGDPDQDELLDQLAEHPDDINLHLELVSLYYHRRDVEHFEAAAEAMYAHITDPQQSEWQDVAAMGEDLVPGHPLFAGVDTSVPESERAPITGYSLDDEGDDSRDADAPLAAAPAAGPAKISEYHFDFNLTPTRPESGRAPLVDDEAAAPVEGGEVDDDALTLDDVPAPAYDDGSADVAGWSEPAPASVDFEATEFSDDPIDTKLDLARAYLDMGDADGARAMLEEVLAEGSQSQRDAARRLLDSIA